MQQETIKLDDSKQDTPFNIVFTWKEQTTTIYLVNGEDVLKLADIFSQLLKTNSIPHKVLKTK
jgi:hypothetical protein